MMLLLLFINANVKNRFLQIIFGTVVDLGTNMLVFATIFDVNEFGDPKSISSFDGIFKSVSMSHIVATDVTACVSGMVMNR